jgi:hypothetical protein
MSILLVGRLARLIRANCDCFKKLGAERGYPPI